MSTEKFVMSSSDSEENDVLATLLEHHCKELSAHFDSVQICATTHDEKSKATIRFDCGNGNCYARIGVVREWLKAVSEINYEED